MPIIFSIAVYISIEDKFEKFFICHIPEMSNEKLSGVVFLCLLKRHVMSILQLFSSLTKVIEHDLTLALKFQ